MKYNKTKPKCSWRYCQFLLLCALLSSIAVNVDAQKPQKPEGIMRSISSTMPNGYVQVGNTDLCYSKNVTNYNNSSYHSIDIQGKFESKYYGSTYGNHGYDVAIQVGDNSATYLDCQTGSTVSGVQFTADVIAQAELARVCYYLTNTNENDVTISLGIHADVMIGNNDSAPIVRKTDTTGSTYGLALLDGNGAQLCVLFGQGLPGVTGVSDYWFGGWSSNHTPSEMVGNYNQGGNWMVENGSYDSGMGWCWKNRVIPAGETVIFSWLIGVGDVNLEPNSSFEVTPEDPDGWNDLTRLHVLTLEGDYESPAGLSGRIEYAVEDSEEWTALTEMLASGSTFTGEARAMFDPTRSSHVIRFRTIDQVGNTTLLPSIVYPDVAFHSLEGISDMTYTGEELFQTGLTCDLAEDQYVLKNYQNNVNVGTASYNIEGVFPYTIGRKTYTFEIVPAPLTGEITIDEEDIVYNGTPQTPAWSFTEEGYENLVENQDYTVEWSNNTLPGNATLTITGIGNYTSTLVKQFEISKAPLTEDLYEITLPDGDISYDEAAHGATVQTEEGVGSVTITYQKNGVILTEAPVDEGSYDIYLAIAEGSLYFGLENHWIGSFTIYKFNEAEWAALQALYDVLSPSNPTWAEKWDEIIHAEKGILNVEALPGVEISQGHVVGLNLADEGFTCNLPIALFTFPKLKVLDLHGNSFSGDIADVVAAFNKFLQTSPNYESELQTLNITGNSMTGNIGLMASNNGSGSMLAHFPSLTTLWASGNMLSSVLPHLPATIVNLDLTCQDTDTEIDADLSGMDVTSWATAIPSLLLYNHQEQSYNTTLYLRLANYPPTATAADYTIDKPYWAVDVSYTDGNINVTCLTDNTYRGQSGDKLYISYPLAAAEVADSYCYTLFEFLLGDANFSGFVEITDLQATINYIFGEYNEAPFNYTAANTYIDSRLNVQDVVSTANIIIESEASQSARSFRTRSANETNAYLYVRDGKLMISTSEPIAAFDITFAGTPDITFCLEDLGYDMLTKQHNGNTRCIAYTLSSQFIPVGETIFAVCNRTIPEISSVMMSNPAARPVSVQFGGSATSANAIGNTAGTTNEYYSPDGVRCSVPVKGVNIVKTITPEGNTTTKVIYIK